MAEQRKVITVGILTVSDSCSTGKAIDKSGENLKSLIESGKYFRGSVVAKDIIPDETEEIKAKLLHWTDHLKLDLVLTTGGTGFAPRDVTPEATKQVLEKEATGMTMAMIKGSLDITPKAMLSRLLCGSRGSTLILNLPGSTKGSAECLEIASPGIPHAVDLLNDRLSDVEKTHRQMIKQHMPSWNDEIMANTSHLLNEKVSCEVTDNSLKAVENQEENVEARVRSCQAYSMLKLVELLIRLAMPSIHQAPAAYKILQSLLSSLSSITNSASIEKTFETWKSALSSVMGLSGNETKTDAQFINFRCGRAADFLKECTMKNHTGSPSSVNDHADHDSSLCTLIHHLNEMFNTSNAQISAEQCELPSHLAHTLDHPPAASSGTVFSNTKELSKKMQSKNPDGKQSLEQKPSSKHIEAKVKTCSEKSASSVSCMFLPPSVEDTSMLMQPSVETYHPCPVGKDVSSMHKAQAMRGSLLSLKSKRHHNEDSLDKPKLIKQSGLPYAHGTSSADIAHYKKLLMDSDLRRQQTPVGTFHTCISGRPTNVKNAMQDHHNLVVLSASPAQSNSLWQSPSKPLSLILKDSTKSLLVRGQDLPSQSHQPPISSPSCWNNLNDNSDGIKVQDVKSRLSHFQIHSDKGKSNKLSFANQNCQQNATPCENFVMESSISPEGTVNDDTKRIPSSSVNPLNISPGQNAYKTEDRILTHASQKSSTSPDIEQSSHISSSSINAEPHPAPLKSAKIHNIHSHCTRGEVLYVPVGKPFIEFLGKHLALKSINLHKGKRDVKRLLVKMCRQADSSSRANSWRRGKEVLERNRLDDFFQLTPAGSREQVQVHCGKKRDQYVVNWYMWCPGHLNCKRKCGGFGQCLDNCKGMLHKQDRHNCSVMVNLKLFLSDLTMWRVHITGSHVPQGNAIMTDLQSSNEDASPKKKRYKKAQDTQSNSNTDQTVQSAQESNGASETLLSYFASQNNSFEDDGESDLAASKIPSKKRISKLLSNLKRRRKGRPYISKSQQGTLRKHPLKLGAVNSNEHHCNDQSKCPLEVGLGDITLTSNLGTDESTPMAEGYNCVNKTYSGYTVRPPGSLNPVSCIETCFSETHSNFSRLSLPATSTLINTSDAITTDSYMNLHANSESVNWIERNTKEGFTKTNEDEVTGEPSSYIPSLSNVDDDFQQQFLHAHTLNDIFHQNASDLPQHFDDFIDVMEQHPIWTSASKHSYNLELSSSPLFQGMSHCSENPEEIGFNATCKLPCTSAAQIHHSREENSSHLKPLTSVTILGQEMPHHPIYSRLPESACTPGTQHSNLRGESLPSYQEARAALGQQSSSEKNIM